MADKIVREEDAPTDRRGHPSAPLRPASVAKAIKKLLATPATSGVEPAENLQTKRKK